MVWDVIGIGEDERNVSLPYKAATYYTILRQIKERLSSLQELETLHSEGKQHKRQSSRTYFAHNKELQSKLTNSASICTNDIILTIIHKQRIEKRKRRHLGRMPNIKKVQNYAYLFPDKSSEEMDMEIQNGVTKAEIDYILTNRPDIFTDVTIINQVNIGSDHRMAMSNIKLDVEVERNKLMAKRLP